jgi:hypothetical protein
MRALPKNQTLMPDPAATKTPAANFETPSHRFVVVDPAQSHSHQKRQGGEQWKRVMLKPL